LAVLLAGCDEYTFPESFEKAQEWCAPYGGVWFVTDSYSGDGIVKVEVRCTNQLTVIQRYKKSEQDRSKT